MHNNEYIYKHRLENSLKNQLQSRKSNNKNIQGGRRI